MVRWLGRSDSNTRMTESESVALPLGDAPMIDYSTIIIAFIKKNKRFHNVFLFCMKLLPAPTSYDKITLTMWKIILTAINAIAPIILLIVLGYILKRIKFLSKDFLKTGNKLVFKVLLPVMLFMNIYDSSWAAFRWDLILYASIAIVVIFGLGLLTSVLTTKRADRRGVILQCTFRSNFAIIGTSLVASLAGGNAQAGATVALLQAFSIPLFNILAVVSLTVFTAAQPEDERAEGEPRKRSLKREALNILKGIATNPLIIAVALGLIFLGLREAEVALFGEVAFSVKKHLTFLYTVLNQIKNIASPFALIILGGQFEFSAVKGMLKEILVGTGWRIVLAPLFGIGVAVLLSKYTDILPLGPGEFPALVALFGSPVAVSSAIMAAEMKNDEQLATQLVVWTSVCSILTIFITVCILMSAGLLAT